MKQFIYSIMTDNRRGVLASAIKALLWVISCFYEVVVNLIRSVRMSTAKRLPCKVVSIGNLTLGGTGKTPLVCMVAKFLKGRGHNPIVLIRGYGDDEWKMLKDMLGDIPVIVGSDRVATGMEACNKFNADTVVLDDGFQHWRLKRDLDIVLVDATDPFGNRKIFPRGILRESINNINRADLVMLAKADMGKENVKEIKSEIKGLTKNVSVFESVYIPLGFYDLETGAAVDLSFINGKNIYALSGIVNNRYFEYMLNKLGAKIISRAHYPDHHDYKRSDLDNVFNECRNKDLDIVVTTEKDAGKLSATRYPLNANLPVRIIVLRIELRITDAEKIFEQRLCGLYSA